MEAYRITTVEESSTSINRKSHSYRLLMGGQYNNGMVLIQFAGKIIGWQKIEMRENSQQRYLHISHTSM